jgi:ATP-dependent DNA ligase
LDLCPYEKFSLPETTNDQTQEEFMAKIDQAYETSCEQNHEGIMVKFPQSHAYIPNNRLNWLKVNFSAYQNFSSSTSLVKKMNLWIRLF